MKTTKTCERCGAMFETTRSTTKMCSKACRVASWHEAHPERVAEIKRKHYDENRDVMLARGKAFAATNPERVKELKREYYDRNRETVIKRSLDWQQENPEGHKKRNQRYLHTPNGRAKSYEKTRRRLARKAAAEGSFTRAEFLALVDETGSICLCCNKTFPLTALEADHIVAITKGGTDWIQNIQPLCSPCNARKGNRHATDYLSAWRAARKKELN